MIKKYSFSVVFFFNSNRYPISIEYNHYTYKELWKELFERARLWQTILGGIYVVRKDLKRVIWEYRFLPNEHIIFQDNTAMYGRAYRTMIWEHKFRYLLEHI